MAGASALATACSRPAPRRSKARTHLKVVPRAEWGAVAPDLTAPVEHGVFDAATNTDGWLEYTEPLAEVLNTLIAHHSALDLSYGPREIQQLHREKKGFADIGYHFLIDAAGTIYEGRDVKVRGAHTGGYNTGALGVVLLGNFELATPSAAQLKALRRVAEYLAEKYTLSHLAGHRDFQPGVTVCPGKALEPLLPDLASELGLTFGTGGYAPPPWAEH